jgi:hypothetical protein
MTISELDSPPTKSFEIPEKETYYEIPSEEFSVTLKKKKINLVQIY